MRFTEEPRYEFYPDIADNLKQPEEQRVTVEIIRPTGYQRKEFETVVATREYYPDDQPFDEKGNVRKVGKMKRVRSEIRVNADYILRNCVGEIRNVTVDTVGKDGKKTAHDIKTGTELAESRAYGIEELISAICLEVQSDTITDSKKKITA